MAIKSIPTAWKDELRTGTLADRDLRLYCDFRGIEYPDLETGSAGYTLAREDNLIDRGNCESTTAPYIDDGGAAPDSDCSPTRSSDYAHGGDYSYKCTKSAAGTDFWYWTTGGSSNTTFTAGQTIEVSFWLYLPTAGGADSSDVFVLIREVDGAASNTNYSYDVDTYGDSTTDAWFEVKFSHTFADDMDTAGIALRCRETPTSAGDVWYADDIRVTSHTVPGSHYLSSGYIETLCPMTETFTLQIKFKSNFAHDTASYYRIFGWYVSGTQRFIVEWNAGSDYFYVYWQDGGTVRRLVSAQYDNGSTHRNINQWITLTAAIDLSTGTTAGSSLWMDKTLDDTGWDGNIDAKTTEFNKATIRGAVGTAGDYDIAYVRLFFNYVATDDDVQNDFKDVANEEIFWSLDGHGTGRTRANINTSGHRVLEHYNSYKGINGKLIESYGANTLGFRLNNDAGEFSDDQNAAWDPANAVYNGTNAQNYLQNRFGVVAESWYSGDFDYLFVGRATEDGFKRQSKNTDYSRVRCDAEDGVGDLDRAVEETGRVFSANMLCRHDTLIDRGGCESTTNPAMYGETSTTLSNATFARSETRSYSGRYSYLGTKTVAAGTAATITLADSEAAGDMHGLTAGNTYTLKAAIYIPTGMLGSELSLAIVDSAGSTTQAASNTYDEWQIVEVEHTLDAGATYAYPQIQIASAAANTETFHIDQIKLIPDDLSEAHDISLFHNIAKRGYRIQRQYLANNNFENTTIGDSWLVTTGGTITKTADTDMLGTHSCRLQPGAAAEQLYQTVLFTGSRKLNVGQTYTLQCYLKSSAAASGSDNYIEISEQDSSGENDSTSETYTLAGGEGYKLASATHSITDKDSDRIVVNIGAAASDDIYVKMTMLCESDNEIYYFEENETDGSSGEVSADDSAEMSWPWFGIDTGNVDYIHPWRRMEQNSTVWENLKSIGAGTGATYCGFDESGTLVNRAILDNGYSDPVPIDTVTDVGTDTNHILLDGLNVFLDAAQANCLYGVGDRYGVGTEERLIWLGSASGAFDDTSGNNQINETVANGDYFPDPDTYGEFWAQYGASGDTPLRTDLTLFPSGLIKNGNLHIPGDIPLGSILFFTKQWNNAYQPASKSDKIIGVQSATLFHKTAGAGDADGALSYVTSGALVSGLDITSRAGEARILLLNDTGGSERVIEVAIVGKPVYKFTGSEGFVHDSFIDRADVLKNGERLLEFGGADVISDQQLNRMADYLWKNRGQRKHIYICASYGALHDIGPNDWYRIDVGQSGTAEDVAGTMVATGIRISADADTHGKTEITYREVEEAWKYDSSAIARFVARGVPIRSPSTAGDTVVVGAEYSTVDTDFRVPSGNTSAEDFINPAITLASETLGGGTVKVKSGTYKTDGPVVMKSNVKLLMEPGVVIEKNHNGYAITAAGSSGSELENIIIEGGKVTRNASDTNVKDLIYFNYVDDFAIRGVTAYDSKNNGIYCNHCDRGVIENCLIDTFTYYGIRIGGEGSAIINNEIKNGGQRGISCDSGKNRIVANNISSFTNAVYGILAGSGSGNGSVIANNTIESLSGDVTCIICGATNSSISNNMIRDITASNTDDITAITADGAGSTVTGNSILTLSATGSGEIRGINAGVSTVISSNTIEDISHTGTEGIYAIHSTTVDAEINNNSIDSLDINNASNSGEAGGIYLSNGSDRNIVNGNKVSNITLTSGGVLSYGIYVYDALCVVSGNNAYTVDDYGIYILGDNNTVSGNTASGCDTGIETRSSADRTVVTGNRATSNTTDNFDDNGTNTTDSGNDWN
jgi:parallel beta-helix repeat protein